MIVMINVKYKSLLKRLAIEVQHYLQVIMRTSFDHALINVVFWLLVMLSFVGDTALVFLLRR